MTVRDVTPMEKNRYHTSGGVRVPYWYRRNIAFYGFSMLFLILLFEIFSIARFDFQNLMLNFDKSRFPSFFEQIKLNRNTLKYKSFYQ